MGACQAPLRSPAWYGQPAIAQGLQVGAVQERQPAGGEVGGGQGFDAGQPIGQGWRGRQGQGRVVRDDPARRGRMGRRQIMGTAGQLPARRSLRDDPVGVGGRTACQQVGVSEVGQQGQPHAGGQGQRCKEVIPEEVLIVGHIVRLAEEQAGPRRFRRIAGEEAVAADVDEDRTLSPARDVPARRGQEGQRPRPIQRIVQAADIIRREAAGQQRPSHGGLVAPHGGFAGLWRSQEEGEMVGVVWLWHGCTHEARTMTSVSNYVPRLWSSGINNDTRLSANATTNCCPTNGCSVRATAGRADQRRLH